MNAQVNISGDGLSEGQQVQGLLWCFLFGMEALVILVTNGVTIAVFANTTKLRRQTSTLLANLAVADLLVGIVAAPGWVYFLGAKFRFWKNQFTVSLNIAYSAIDIFAAFASVTNHGCIAVERMIATFMPFTHRSKKRQLNLMFVAVVWILALIVPALTNVGFYVLRSQMFAFYVWMPFLTVLLMLISLSYWFVLRRMKSLRRDLRKESQLSHRFTITALIVTAVSLITWLPFMIMSTVNLLQPVNQDLRLVNPVKFLHFANSFCNPIIYCCRIPNFRLSVYTVIFRRTPERKFVGIRQRRTTRRASDGDFVTHL